MVLVDMGKDILYWCGGCVVGFGLVVCIRVCFRVLS